MSFQPSGTVHIAATNLASASAALPVDNVPFMIVVDGTVGAYVAFGSSTVVAAAATGIYIPHNHPVFFYAPNCPYVAAITTAGSATVVVTSGTFVADNA